MVKLIRRGGRPGSASTSRRAPPHIAEHEVSTRPPHSDPSSSVPDRPPYEATACCGLDLPHVAATRRLTGVTLTTYYVLAPRRPRKGPSAAELPCIRILRCVVSAVLWGCIDPGSRLPSEVFLGLLVDLPSKPVVGCILAVPLPTHARHATRAQCPGNREM